MESFLRPRSSDWTCGPACARDIQLWSLQDPNTTPTQTRFWGDVFFIYYY